MTKRSARIFAAAAHAARQGFRGGLFRTTPDDGVWEELENGLPELVETHALAVDPGILTSSTQARRTGPIAARTAAIAGSGLAFRRARRWCGRSRSIRRALK